MIERARHASIKVIAFSMLAAVLGAASAASAQVTERQRHDAIRMLTAAQQLFDDARLEEAVAAFGRLVDAARGATADLEMRVLLVRAYAYRAQAHLVLGQAVQARNDLTALVRLDASFVLDDRETPAALRAMHADVLRVTSGTLVFDLPPTAVAIVDGRALPAGTVTLRIVEGMHRVLLADPGRLSQAFNVGVSPLGSHAVRFTETSAPVTSESPPAASTAIMTCRPVPLTPGTSVDGRLENSSCLSTRRSGRRTGLYTFEGVANQSVTMTLNGPFDTYLILVGPDGRIVAEDDDGGNGTNSHIQTRLPSTGSYTVEAMAFDEGGRGTYTLSVQATAVSASQTATVPPAPPRAAAPPEGQAARGGRRMRAFVHSSLPMVLYTSSYSSAGSFQQSYVPNRTAAFTIVQSPQIRLGAYEFGAGYGITGGGGFAIGLTHSKSYRYYEGVLDGTVPMPVGAGSRPVSGVDVPTRDVERAYHVEVRGQFGGRRHQTALYIGPSFIELERDVVRQVSIAEAGGGLVNVTPVHTSQRERQIGWNMGLDVAWYPARYVGVGVGMRYVLSNFHGSDGGTLQGFEVPRSHAMLVTAGLRARF